MRLTLQPRIALLRGTYLYSGSNQFSWWGRPIFWFLEYLGCAGQLEKSSSGTVIGEFSKKGSEDPDILLTPSKAGIDLPALAY
jgi:hypothetical protein